MVDSVLPVHSSSSHASQMSLSVSPFSILTYNIAPSHPAMFALIHWRQRACVFFLPFFTQPPHHDCKRLQTPQRTWVKIKKSREEGRNACLLKLIAPQCVKWWLIVFKWTHFSVLKGLFLTKLHILFRLDVRCTWVIPGCHKSKPQNNVNIIFCYCKPTVFGKKKNLSLWSCLFRKMTWNIFQLLSIVQLTLC